MNEGLEAMARRHGDRRFWYGFGLAWCGYFLAIFAGQMVAGGSRLGTALAIALVNAMPPTFAAWVVALNRRRLLRPEWTIGRTIAVHAVVGCGFALVTATLAESVGRLWGTMPAEMAGGSEAQRFLLWFISASFLYVVFLGFLLWSESIRRVQESHRAAAREAVLRAEAEAKALRAQFNPHFVFNTLHSLMLLVRSDPTAAERAIEDVATLIRYASILQRRNLDLVPLTTEVEVVRRYVALEHLRLAERLTVTWRVEVDPSAHAIPAFGLQVLVENAIKHGVSPRDEPGRVEIEIHDREGWLTIVVSDDGVGADPEHVESEPGHGLGLLRGRLGSVYSEEASLDYRTGRGEGFRVTLRLPVRVVGASSDFESIAPREPIPSHA